MLEARLQNARYDLNGLKGKVRQFGEYYILYDLARGRAPSWMLEKNPLDGFLDAILAQGACSAASPEEKEWLENLQIFRSGLRGFDARRYLSMNLDERARYSSSQGIRFAELLAPLVRGYVDKRDRKCPYSSNPKEGVTKDSWENHLNPRRYFDMCNRMIFPKNDQGVGICPDIAKDE